MKCQEVANELIAYLDRRANSAERRQVEEHLAVCAPCRTRAEEFRKVWNVLDEVPSIGPSLGFDARLRQRVAAEPRPRWTGLFVPQPRLALSMALLIALSVWMAKMPPTTSLEGELGAKQQFEMIKDLPVLENYDVLSKFDALSELGPAPATQPAPEKDRPANPDGGGS
jgi:anti-sigma factor RsiW